MVRTVSEEDYLLGRGANPRTGTITPLSGSIDVSNVQAVQSPPRSATAPTKWTQRGDQWISHDFEDSSKPAGLIATPSSVLPQVPKSRKPQQLNEKQRIFATGRNSGDEKIYHTKFVYCFGTSPACPGALPGTIPRRPVKASPDPRGHPQAMGIVVKRKPVAKSAIVDQQSSPANTDQSHESPLATTKFKVDNTLRSAGLLSGPRQLSSPEIISSHFRDSLIVKSSLEVSQESSRLQTDDGLLLQSRSASGPLVRPSRYHAGDPKPRAIQRRLPSPPIFRERSSISLHDPITLKFTSPPGHSRSDVRPYMHPRHQMSTIPTYDNPPPKPAMRNFRPRASLSRETLHSLQRGNHGPTVIGNIPDPFSVASTRKQIFVPTGNTRVFRQQLASYYPGESPATILGNTCTDTRSRPYITRQDMGTSLTASSGDIPLPLRRPRGLVRPHMPSRATGMHCVPRVSELQGASSPPRMGQQNGSDMIDTRQINMEGKGSMNTTKNTKTSPANKGPICLSNEYVKKPATEDSLTREHNQCQDEFLRDGISSSIETSEASAPNTPDRLCKAAELHHQVLSCDDDSDRKKAQVTIVSIPEGLQDNPISCLGSGPELSSLRLQSSQPDEHGMQGAKSPSTSSRTSTESSISIRTEEKNNRFALIKTKLKSHFKKKHIDNSLSKWVDRVQAPTAPTTLHPETLHSSPQRKDDQLLVFQVPRKRPTQAASAIQRSSESHTTSTKTPPTFALKTERKSCEGDQSRRISEPRSCSSGTSMTVLELQRSLSVPTSSKTVPRLDRVSLAGIGEFLIVVPIKAIRMWLHNNPEAINLGLLLLERACEWSRVIIATSQLILNAIYIYSETGRIEIEDIDGKRVNMAFFTRDCLRSTLYLIILVSLAVFMRRLLGLILFPLRTVVWSVRYLLSGCREVGIL